MSSLCSELVDGEDGGFGVCLEAAVKPSNKGKATTCAIFAQLPVYRYLRYLRAVLDNRGLKSRAEQDELSLQTRVSDVSVTPLLGIDPAQGNGDSSVSRPGFC